jgi:hypothetical protein
MRNLKEKFSLIVALSLFFSGFSLYGEKAEASTYSRVTEIIKERTEYSRTFRNSNLSETIDVFPLSVFEKNDLGQYVPKEVSKRNGQIAVVSNSENPSETINTNALPIGVNEQGTYRGYLNFKDVLPNLENKLIVSAKLQMYELGNANQPGYYDPQHKDGSYSIHNVLEDWDASSLSWDNQPAISEQPAVLETEWKYTDSARFVWDVTGLVTGWYRAPASSYGIAVKASDETQERSLRSFYKNDSNLNYLPVLQINYHNMDIGLNGRGFGNGENTGEGYINLQWFSASGAKGYKVLMFNGKDYEEIDVGNVTSWSTQGKNIWPLKDHVLNGGFHLRLDGSGGPLADTPGPLYVNAGAENKNPYAYYFRILAYNDHGSALSDEIAVSIPDQTAPTAPSNLRVNELISDFTVSWDESVDDRTGIKEYQVTLENTINGRIITRSTAANRIKFEADDLRLGEPYKISVRAVDNNVLTKGNHSEAAVITATPRELRSAKIKGYSIPDYELDVSSNPTLRLFVINEGTEEWSQANGYEVRVEGLRDTQRLPIDGVVKTGEDKSFEIKLTGEKPLGTVPVKVGIYHRDTGWVGEPAERSMTFSDMEAPLVNFHSPAAYEKLAGDIRITGEITDYQLESYSLHYGAGAAPADWMEIGSFNHTGGGFSHTWNTKGIPPGSYTLRVMAVDTSGNKEIFERRVSINLPPMTPLVTTVTDALGSVSGTAELGTTIRVTKGGMLLGSGITTANGTFAVKIPLQPAGSVLEVTAANQYGNISQPQKVTVIDKTPPLVPKVNAVADNATVVTGTAEKGATIKVVKGTTAVGTATVKTDGTYAVTIQKQPAGTILDVTATDKALNVSGAAKTTVLDKTPPPVPRVNAVADNAVVVTGTAEKGATVKVVKGSTTLGTVAVKTDGTYAVKVPKHPAGTILVVTATDKALNVSGAAKITVVDKTPPSAPKVNAVSNTSTSITGTAEKYAVIRIMKGSTLVATTTAGSDGKYSAVITKQSAGTILSVTATDKAKNVSGITRTTVLDKIAPAIPTVYAVYSYHTSVKGKAEAYSHVTVKRGTTVLGTGQTDSKGNFTVKVAKQKKGAVLSVTARDKAGNVSKARAMTVR